MNRPLTKEERSNIQQTLEVWRTSGDFPYFFRLLTNAMCAEALWRETLKRFPHGDANGVCWADPDEARPIRKCTVENCAWLLVKEAQ